MHTRTAAKISDPLRTFASRAGQDQPMAEDTYSAGQTAKLLGISERRVRQLAATGVLDVVQPKPLRISALSAIEERKRRKRSPKPETSAAGPMDQAQLRELVTAIISDLMPLALEGQRRVEDSLREELAASRAEAAQLRAQLDAQPRKKGKGKGKKGRKGKAGKGKKRSKLLGII